MFSKDVDYFRGSKNFLWSRTFHITKSIYVVKMNVSYSYTRKDGQKVFPRTPRPLHKMGLYSSYIDFGIESYGLSRIIRGPPLKTSGVSYFEGFPSKMKYRKKRKMKYKKISKVLP